MTTKVNHLSASSIASFKACPQRYRLAYVEGLRPERDTDSLRVGTNWHAMHEEYANAFQDSVQDPPHQEEEAHDSAMNAVVRLLNNRYAEVPSWLTADQWALERQILLTSFVGYQWYFQNDPIDFLASEIPFNLPLVNPEVGLPMPVEEVQRVGKIDHVILYRGGIMALERKSTSKSLAPDSDFWQRWTRDDQISMYAMAFRDMRDSGQMDWLLTEVPPRMPEFRMDVSDEARTLRYGNTLLDVWRKPTIKPTTLTQKETAEFIASKQYMGQEFAIEVAVTDTEHFVTVDGERVVVEQGKKGFAIKETIEMYGARLLQDIYADPTKYFVRREIARTDAEIADFQKSLWNVYQAQTAFGRSGLWYGNYSQCRATFTCPYVSVCFGSGADAVCDGRTVPTGFKRIFVDLTVNGKAVGEEE